jgi:hypothetical protein
VIARLSRIFVCAALRLPKESSQFRIHKQVVLEMRRFFSAILVFGLTCPAPVGFTAANSVAAQEVQQQQKSGSLEAEIPVATQDAKTDIQIPDGTLIDIEAPYTLNSMDFKPNDKISFHVVNPIKVNGVTVIEQGAVATGRIDKAKRGGHFGKAGLFVWTMQTVTGVDGSQIPLRVAPTRVRGDSKAAKVATQMIITGALLPIIAPVALLHGFKRGKDAFIPAGKRYSVYVEGSPTLKMPVTTREQ